MGGAMFNQMLGESVAKAAYWLLIIFGIGITARFLIRDIIDFMLEDKSKKPPEVE
jgi:hypothetical protein